MAREFEFNIARTLLVAHPHPQLRATYIPELSACGVTQSAHSRVPYIGMLTYDAICLVLIFIILSSARGKGLWMLLVSQVSL